MGRGELHAPGLAMANTKDAMTEVSVAAEACTDEAQAALDGQTGYSYGNRTYNTICNCVVSADINVYSPATIADTIRH
jgi:hypothetical protein